MSELGGWVLGKKIKLNPCPFCGGDERNLCSSPDGHFVECTKCNAKSGCYDTFDESVKAMYEPELKPCPFCGGEGMLKWLGVVKKLSSGEFKDRYIIECEDCDCSTKTSSENGAIKAWNARHDHKGEE